MGLGEYGAKVMPISINRILYTYTTPVDGNSNLGVQNDVRAFLAGLGLAEPSRPSHHSKKSQRP